ncbi:MULTISPECIES: 16S rRNA (cytidine(1402)-2'-O)-methyltransferase [Virgibacillus]|uniref:Ribosomal RNA small subunit methyltransferase I n=1 Tax=Virgibacillus dokdonensis TaxID=302167 RepID=A0A2K9IYE6_9BACI|nr:MULTISPECIES: 16S rRNA (cytidine(1402)-2'-O)-methyltransferase [Virgibacillus]AUJ24474.1 Ribosomal RNA small subunit methyltransferase I [Virgibacillus dokdonensis]NWO12920.1 16S rRNA (cytidine(1402)-2'-O)-methyltransferase [Virgibacillus sp.]
MNLQNSFDKEGAAVYVVPTPIGNLEDITYRALTTLQSVSVIAAEDTRNTKNLLRHFEITTPLISYHEHNKLAREEQLLSELEQGESIALVSDAGMPAISDPGQEIIQAAIKQDIPVIVLPGANAALCALVGSGLPTSEFYFYGFLPRKKKEKVLELERLAPLQATLLFYESPYRLRESLQAMRNVFGNRQVAFARELTKRFESYLRGTLDEVIAHVDKATVKGECCIVLEGATEIEQQDTLWWSNLTIIEHVEHYLQEEALSSKDAIKRVAQDRQLPKREVYQNYHVR